VLFSSRWLSRKPFSSLLGVQARLEASVQKHDEQIAKLESSVTTLTDLVGRLAQAEIHLVERLDRGFREVREIQAHTERRLNALIEQSGNTENKLNSLIDTVDKLVRRDGSKEWRRRGQESTRRGYDVDISKRDAHRKR
jgi:chromosome segregation ATPase